MKFVPMIGSPPMPTAVDCPKPDVAQLPGGFISQRAALADQSHGAGIVNVTGHNADFRDARRDDAGTIRSDEAAVLVLAKYRLDTRTMSSTGMPSVIADDQLDAGIGRFHNGIAAKRRRDENHRRVGPGLSPPPLRRCRTPETRRLPSPLCRE